MRFFFAGLRLQLVRLLRQKAIALCLLLLPLLVLAMGLLLPDAEQNIIKVGILLPEDSARAERIWNRLLEYSDPQIRFVRADSEDQVREMVAGRAWECGYMFPENLDERLTAGGYQRLITRVMSPASMPLFAGWTLSSVVVEECVSDIALGYLVESGLLASESIENIPPFAGGIDGGKPVLSLQMEEMEGSTEGGAGASLTGATLARGVMALLLFLVAYLCAVRHRDDMGSGFFTRLSPYVPSAQLFLPSLGASGLLLLVAGALAVCLGRVFFPNHFSSLPAEGLLLLLYLASLTGFAFLLSVVVKNREVLITALPFWMILCLLLSPILLDIGQWIPAARWLDILLPPALYLRAAAGSADAPWQMGLMAVLSFLAGLLPKTSRSVPG